MAVITSVGCSCGIYFLCFHNSQHEKMGMALSTVFSSLAVISLGGVAVIYDGNSDENRSSALGLKAFSSAVSSFLLVVIKLLFFGGLGYLVYRLNPDMDSGLQVEVANTSIPFDISLIMLSPLIKILRTLIMREFIASRTEVIADSFGEYIHIRLLSAFFFCCAPLLKDFRCEIPQAAGLSETDAL